jgi:hypothetical protein
MKPWPNQSATAIRRVLENPEKNFVRREPSLRAQTSPLQRRPTRAFPAAGAELDR